MIEDFKVDIKFGDSFLKKANSQTWKDIISGALDDFTLEAERQCKKECPVDTGTLMRGHNSDLPYGFEKHVTNDVEYAPYVIDGTIYMMPNDYPSHVMFQLENSRAFEQALEKNEKKFGVK